MMRAIEAVHLLLQLVYVCAHVCDPHARERRGGWEWRTSLERCTPLEGDELQLLCAAARLGLLSQVTFTGGMGVTVEQAEALVAAVRVGVVRVMFCMDHRALDRWVHVPLSICKGGLPLCSVCPVCPVCLSASLPLSAPLCPPMSPVSPVSPMSPRIPCVPCVPCVTCTPLHCMIAAVQSFRASFPPL